MSSMQTSLVWHSGLSTFGFETDMRTGYILFKVDNDIHATVDKSQISVHAVARASKTFDLGRIHINARR
jgi:hypothetical protein